MTRARPLQRGCLLIGLLLLAQSWAILWQAAAFPDWTDCPSVCRCKWTSGKKSALCPEAGLTSLPASLDPDMQVIDLSGNRIPALQAEVFKHAALLNLQRVFLRQAGIHEIHWDAFKDMRILVEIDLSDNHLRALEARTFTGNERLKLLVLSGNPLRTLRAHQFPMLQHLRTLELQRCSLVQVHPLAFQRLPALETLSLDNNELEYLQADTISGLKRLKTLGLDNNPWSCDCRLRDFCRLLTSGALTRLYSVQQTCIGPARLQGRSWEEVRATEFACEPTVFLPANSIQEEINGNVSLACLASGDPEPEVWWQLNGGPVNGTRRALDEVGAPGGIVTYSTSLETRRRLVERWSNLTIYNASDADAGEYTCHARNLAGTARNTVLVNIPRVFTAPTLSQADNWLLWVGLAGGGTVAVCVFGSVVLLGMCLCGAVRRRKRGAKVKLQASASFGDQEKKLLDLSVTTTATTTSQQQQQQQQQQHPQPQNQPDSPSLSHPESSQGQPELELELELEPPSTNVTVERLRLHQEFRQSELLRTSGPGLPASIFISVALASQQQQHQAPAAELHERCYPDLLDIGLSSFATLPRRNLNRRELGSPYDNMGPRVTATGSSTFSLVEQPEPLVPLIQPPPEFVSL